MKKLLSVLAFVLVVVFAGRAQSNTVRIMGIGNSFTVDALEQHFQPILDAMGIDAIVGYPYRGGTWLSEHADFYRRDTTAYNYRKFTHGNYTTTGLNTATLRQALEDEPWDYVFIQSDHDSAGIAASYYPHIDSLVTYIRRSCSNPNVQIGLYMTWAYDQNSNYRAFPLYGSNTTVMYDSIVNAIQGVMTHTGIDLVIPSGTAIQNARTSYKGQTLNRDGYHLNYDYGRYITALCWYSTIFGDAASNVTYTPTAITDYCGQMCRAAADSAILVPFAVTSLAANYSQTDEEIASRSDDSSLGSIRFNGMNVPVQEGVFDYNVPVNGSLTTVVMQGKTNSTTASFNVTIGQADIENDPARPGYFEMPTPAAGTTTTVQVRVIAQDVAYTTTYTYHLVPTPIADLEYPIASIEDLDAFAEAVNGGQYSLNAKMTASFNCGHTNTACWKTPIGTDAHPYTGTFDGNGKTIDGFVIYAVDDATLYACKYVGLFGAISNATIKNLTIKSTTESYCNRPSVSGMTSAVEGFGFITGFMGSSIIRNCHVNCPLFTNLEKAHGAICGYEAGTDKTKPSLIEHCSSAGTWRIRRSGQYAGILGYGYNVTIKDCYSTCKLQLQKDFAARLGGILGYVNASASGNRAVAIQSCFFYGSLSDDRTAQGVTTAQTIYLGGIASVFNGDAVTTSACYFLSTGANNAFGQHKNYTTKQTATKATAAQFADGTVLSGLTTGVWEQGSKYPEFYVAPVIDPEPEEPTAVDEQQASAVPCTKRLVNGQLLLFRNGACYTLSGQRIE